MTATVRLKTGALELECTGTQEFVRQELPFLISSLAQMQGAQTRWSDMPECGPAVGARTASTIAPSKQQVSVTTVASRLQVKTGAELVEAASLCLTRRLDTFDRDQLMSEMRAASGFFKANYINNLTGYVRQLIRQGRLLEHGKDAFSLEAKTRRGLEDRLDLA